MKLEVCAYNIQSCLIAQQAGASRIELCADPDVGGTTPSYGLVAYAVGRLSIPVFPMVRPRGGNFIYDADEIAIMKKDIRMFRDMGCPGIATGVQDADGAIALDVLKELVELAYPMQVTCHKVFDVTNDPLLSLAQIIEAGCKRVLTSGTRKTALEGADILVQLIEKAADRIIIMPGGGVRSGNIADLAERTGAKEFHTSGILQMTASPVADGNEIRTIVESLTKVVL